MKHGSPVTASVSLDDKYLAESGRAFMTGVQALVRLPLDRKRLDRKSGLNTAGFISGYRGSPLGGSSVGGHSAGHPSRPERAVGASTPSAIAEE